MANSSLLLSSTAMLARMRNEPGFIAALDQSGGSTPKTLVRYGVSQGAWSGEEQMFDLIHQMRCRILTSPVFRADKILAVILFERTMDGVIDGRPVPEVLHEKGIVPFLKVDQGLEAEADGVQMMKTISGLNELLSRASKLGIFGTKMRAVIKRSTAAGIEAVVRQQFELAELIADAGLVPILEPEYDIAAPDRVAGEVLLREELLKGLDMLPADRQVILKLSIPAEPHAYRQLARHPRVARLAALSGGYSRGEACRELAKNDGMIASFSRALIQDLRVWMTPDEFDTALAQAIDEIYDASIHARE